MRSAYIYVVVLSVWGLHPAGARILTVGPGRTFQIPSEAAAFAGPGDTIRILPGRYVDCAVWSVDDLTIEGAGPGAVIAEKVCRNQALFVIAGRDVTIRNLTFTGARDRVHNGAGIRAAGADLTIQNSRFIDNEEGILAGANPDSTITIGGSTFEGNGNCISACAHGVYVGAIALLRVEHCEFLSQRVGHHIKSRAARTEILDNTIHDGPAGTASYLLDLPNGGNILIRGNDFEKGPGAQNRVAVAIGEEKGPPRNKTERIDILDNYFRSDFGHPSLFVLNCTRLAPRLEGNSFAGVVTPLGSACPAG